MTRDIVPYRFSQAVGELRMSAIALHRRRYLEVGFMPEGFQDPYEKDSIYFVAQPKELFQVVGVCRLVLQELRTLPTYAHFDLFHDKKQALRQLKPGTYAELGAFAVLSRHHGLSSGLIATALGHASAQGMTHVLCCVDQDFHRNVRMFLDIPLETVGPGKLFYGSIKIPCVLNIAEALERLRISRPQAFQPLSSRVGGPGRAPPPVRVA
ncbi:N-acyl amino acid synthase FeeM domain-containing protein [Cystobacter ferrugineus]|uniref:N-acyl amino acid synthase FeeM domain-containing protein n=1 Tax=Cystobacter ferrugineus TaxID=83449 RepID=UPI000AE6071C|nr:hypothetical protein [Cystobacter ferrugineus]